jgi:hypothetical protein
LETLSTIIKNHLWPIVVIPAIDDGKISILLKSYPKLNKNQKNDLSNYYSKSHENIPLGIAAFKAEGLNFILESLTLDDRNITTNIIAYIQKNYPIHEGQNLYMINSFSNQMQTSDLINAHLQNFVCKKVNKYKGFKELIREASSKNEKKRLRNLRDQICP